MMLLCLLLLAPSADDGKAARALLDRAIAALGGEKLLSAPHALTGKSKGTVTGDRTAVSNTWTVQGLDRLLWDSELGTSTFKIGLGAKSAWISGNGNPANDIPKEHADVFRKGIVALRVAESLVDLRGKGWKLSSLGELKIDDRPAVGIKAERKGEPAIDLYFDRKTLLPVQAELRLPKPGESAEMVVAGRFSDYRKVAGRQHFHKLTVTNDGKAVLEMERSEIKVIDRLDDATFEKP